MTVFVYSTSLTLRLGDDSLCHDLSEWWQFFYLIVSLSFVFEPLSPEFSSGNPRIYKKKHHKGAIVCKWRIELDYSRFTRVASALIGEADRHTSVWLSLVGELTFREPKSLPITSNKKTTPLRVLLFYWRIEWDSNSRYPLEVHTISNRAPSTTRPSILLCRSPT